MCRPWRPASACRSKPPRRSGRERRRVGERLRCESPFGRSLSTSFIEWTQKSTSPSISARSSSLVHSALPPISASGLSWILSPVVLISTIWTQPSGQRCAVSIAAATLRACASASGDPRVPRRSPCMSPPLVQISRIRQRAGREMTVILGLESSCDDSAAALVTGDRRILAQAVVGQNRRINPMAALFRKSLRARTSRSFPALIEKVLDEAKMSIHDVDAIAATAGPGLIGGVMVALLAGKGLALAAGKPLIAVNHLEGHALSPRLADPDLDFPYLLLLVSGGHCQLLEVRGVGDYRRLATTIDDAAGEAFDKAAKLLGLPYPGGPAIEELARAATRRPFRCRGRWLARASRISPSPGSRARCSAQSPQATFHPRTLLRAFSRRWSTASSTERALALERSDAPALVVAGGVAANQAIRSAFAARERDGRAFSVPPAWLCTDNAAMIAWAGAERFAAGQHDRLDVPARARWPLDRERGKGPRRRRESMKLGIIGGGAWGTALAQIASTGGARRCCGRSNRRLSRRSTRAAKTPLFLPGVPLSPAIRATAELRDLDVCDAVARRYTGATHAGSARPAPGLRQAAGPLLEGHRGKNPASAARGRQRCLSRAQVAVLSGPTFAHEVRKGLPTAVTLAARTMRLLPSGCAIESSLRHFESTSPTTSRERRSAGPSRTCSRSPAELSKVRALARMHAPL